MVDMLKITSPVGVKNRIDNLPKRQPGDTIFDIFNPDKVTQKPLEKTKQAEGEGTKQSLLQNLNKEIFEPLLVETKAQADSMRKFVLMARLFETSSGIISESFLDKLFIRPQELLGELLAREKGETVFKGEFFDSLRMLAKIEGQPKLKEAILSILKHFDCFANQENSLQSILKQSENLKKHLPKVQGELVQQQIEKLETLIGLNKENRKDLIGFLKSEYIPMLGSTIQKYQSSDQIRDHILAIIHHIVRLDKADPSKLEEAVFHLGEELKPLTNLTDEDLLDMKKLLFQHAKDAQNREQGQGVEKATLEKFGIKLEDSDMASLLSKALDNAAPGKISQVAQSLLLYMVQSESPVLPLMHFMIPFRFSDENTYGEFFIDKNCEERKGEAKQANNIFFTIQSDKYGNFEVDLLAKDQRIDLDIRCPDILVETLKQTKVRLKDLIQDQGYQLSNYQVGAYQEGQTIMQRFPKLAKRKVGIDVKI